MIRSICTRSWGVARLMKGKSARFRARRMRLLMTMSASGPLPRSHSPLVWVSSLSSTAAIPASGPLPVLNAPDLIAEFGGPLVVLALDRFLHFPAEADQLRPLLAARPGAARPLAHVLRLRRECS